MKTAQYAGCRAFRPFRGVLFFVFLALCASAAESSPALSSDVTQTVWLERRDVNQLIQWSAYVAPQSQPFAKEPGLGKRGVTRGTLRLAGVSDPPTAFIWDQPNGKLYLDLNQNHDLTDEVPLGFSAIGRHSYLQTFTNICLTSKAPAIPVSISFYEGGGNSVANGMIGLRSFWASKVTLSGREFEIGYIPEMAGRSGYLVLRAWGERQREFTVMDGSLAAFDFCPNLFVGTNGYRLECNPEQQEGALKYRLTLREKAVELGELKLEGQFVKRLVLTGNPDRLPIGRFMVLLDNPGPVSKIPVGTYGQSQVLVAQGGVEAYRQPVYAGASSPSFATITSESGKTAALKAGGPLTNTVSASRRGGALSLSYQLTAADGFNYRLVSTGPAKPPRLSISKNGKVVHADNFQFG